MIDIVYLRGISQQADYKLLEKSIDDAMLERARQGFTSYTIKTISDTQMDAYKYVLRKYKVYDITYGKNHDNLNLIKISW